jgi:hypothetical protein
LEAVQTRKAEAKDNPFILASWLNHYKNYSYFAKRIKNDVYYGAHERVIKLILARKSCHVLIAYTPAEPDVILGFIVYEDSLWPDPVVHFVYVKKPFRRFGIARELVKASGLENKRIQFTHWTYDVDNLIKKFTTLIYNPYAL